jgi:hypothetical protein
MTRIRAQKPIEHDTTPFMELSEAIMRSGKKQPPPKKMSEAEFLEQGRRNSAAIRGTPRAEAGMYMMPVKVASIAAQISFRSKQAAKIEYRRYYAGAVQIAFAELSEAGIKLFITDHPEQCRTYSFAKEREILAFLTDALIGSPA